MTPLALLILAAGQGTRMCSHTPKVLHELAGWPLLRHVIQAAKPLNPERIVVVTGYQAEKVEEAMADPSLVWARQTEQKGTGHAARCALPALEGFAGDLLILSGDVPLLSTDMLRAFVAQHQAEERDLSVLSATLDPPSGYGRVVRDDKGLLSSVVEDRDADAFLRRITEVNAGIYCLSTTHLAEWLGRLTNANAQGEFYLTDIIPMAVAAGEVGLYHHEDGLALSGVNDRQQLARLEKLFRDRQVARLMASGVSFVDPDSCWLAADVVVGMDTVIAPHVLLGEGVVIGEGCRIGPFCEIVRSHLGAGTVVKAFSHLDGAVTRGPNEIGPYARLRTGSVLEAKAKVGNFCELKKTHVGEGSKINHLSYVGDTEMGKQVNVGAGTITCNYDGVNKHKTTIGDGVFIGSGTQLVAPVTLASGSVIGAGSAITKDVQADALALTRAPQRVVPAWPRPKKKS